MEKRHGRGGVNFRVSRSVFQVHVSHLFVTAGQLIKIGLLCAFDDIKCVGHPIVGQHISLSKCYECSVDIRC